MRRVGVAWAKEMILGGQAIDTSTAERIGLVNRVFPAQDLVAAAVEAGQSVAAGGPLAVALAKRVLQARQDDGAQLARALEQHAFGLVASSHDRAEGMDAFLEKRDPKFTGT